MTLKRTLAVLVFTLAAPLAFGQADETGAEPVRTPDRSTTCTLAALNAVCAIQLEGRPGAGFLITTTNLNAFMIPEVSFDDAAVTWKQSHLMDTETLVRETGHAYTGGAATLHRTFIPLGGVKHVRIRLTTYVSGTATIKMSATSANSPQFVFQGDGGPFWVAGYDIDGSPVVVPYPVRIGAKDGAGNVQDIITDADGRLEITPAQRTSANNDGACVSVTASTTVLASLATRKGFTLFARETNTDVVYIKMGATATSSDFPLPAGSAYNMQAGVVYTGVIDAIAASGTQSVCVLEF